MSSSTFTVNEADLQYILKQIVISERHSAGEALTDIIGPDAHIVPYGLRTVDGQFNNLVNPTWGAADQNFPRLTIPEYRNEGDDSMSFGPGAPVLTNNDYATPGDVADADPRIISNLVVDQTNNNPAAVAAWYSNPIAQAAYADAHAGAAPPAGYVPTNEELMVIFNQSPDIGLSPGFNGWFTFFGQFFDHGLDLVTKGDNGTVFIPLQPDDPLIAGADHVFNTPDDLPQQLRFMALTRATPRDGSEAINTTTPFVDQNQTYTSNASHQVFLREYAFTADSNGDDVPDSHALSTGRLLDGNGTGLDALGIGTLDGAIANWAEVKAQALTMLGIRLGDFDVHNVPLLAVDPYGNFIPGPNGYAQLVMLPDATHATTWLQEGTAAGISTDGAVRTDHAFLNDIAHHAVPSLVDPDRIPGSGDEFLQRPDDDPGVGDDGLADTYDDEMLNSHFVTGDGRGNENIGLTTVHTIFHSEHNRLVADYQHTILASGDRAFINEWLRTDLGATDPIPTDPAALDWDGNRLFQAGRFVTEMQYQHLVFEEFARRVQPNVDPFVFSNSADINAAIVGEFAHAVYRFGHSMLTDTVARLDNNLVSDDVGLIQAFLNPQEFVSSGTTIEEAAGAVIRGMTRQVGNEIDEFVVDTLRNNLLGLPLDLPALNIARGRDTGVPSFNHVREQFYEQTSDQQLKPYENWLDYAQNLKNPTSIINFIAAYGTHPLITAETTLVGKRAAAFAIVTGQDGVIPDDPATAVNEARTIVAPTDRLDFLHATGIYAPGAASGGTVDNPLLGGLNNVDLWIGGLAERLQEFGGMLGSTFNYVFEHQMELLQNGDRFYYLSRTQGQNLVNQLEPNTFTELVMRNTSLGDLHSTHLNGHLFTTPDYILELDPLVRQVTDVGPDGAFLPGGTADPQQGDPFLQIVEPKVTRINGTTDVNGDGEIDGNVLRFRGGEHVVLGGTEGNDRLFGDKGIDTLWGDGGNDYLDPGMESDEAFGGDGDDIISDPFGDDFLRGEDGNDVISGGPGIDVLFGGNGNDFVVTGADGDEVFAGIGTDFVLGGAGIDNLMGNEGDDWLEGGEGFDTCSGENSELFFNSLIIGNDVMDGGANDTDYDGEAGADIMFQGAGIQRNNGMAGFDWAIHQNDPIAADSDLGIPIFVTEQALILRDRFDLTEGLSGWNLDDTLIGRNVVVGLMGPGAAVPDPGQDPRTIDSNLRESDMRLISGLRDLFTFTSWDTTNQDAIVLDTSNAADILLGGVGSDRLFGKGGDDVIDGDKWLHVYISVRANNDGTGAEVERTESMSTLQSRMLSGALNPGQLVIVREIVDSEDDVGVDTAIFSGNRDEYTITQNVDGTLTVAHTGGTASDGVDTLSNIERLQFLDQIVQLSGLPTNSGPPTGQPLISDLTPTEGSALTVSLTNLNDPDGVNLASATFQWQQLVGGVWQNIVGAEGASFTPGQPQVGLSVRVLVDFLDLGGFAESSTSDPTSVVGDLFIGTAGPDVYAGSGGADDASGLGASDDLRGGLGDDILRGGDGNDQLRGLGGVDTTDGGAGNDTHYVGSALDVVIEGVGQGTADRVLADASYTLAAGVEVELLAVRLRGSAIEIDLTGNEFNNRIIGNNGTNVLDGAGGNDALLGNGAADIMEGGTGNDSLRGLSGDDILDGGLGNDVLRGEIGNDTILLGVDFGSDVAHGFDADATDGQDLIDVSALGITAGTFAADVTITQAGTATVIHIGDDSLRLFLTNAATIDATDFLFA